jgi:hypothetical protein
LKTYITLKQLILSHLVLVLVLASAFLTYRALAAPEGAPDAQSSGMDVLAYQGTLVDAGGDTVDGAQAMTFRIYNHPTEGGALWAEAHTGANAVPVQNGLFNVTLGSLNPIPDSVWTETELYLGVQVGGDPEMTPREAIHLLPPRIEAGSLDAAVLKDNTLGNGPFPSYAFGMNLENLIYLNNHIAGTHTELVATDCPVDGGWCCNAADTICLSRLSSDPDLIAFRMEESHSEACWLVHQEDDHPNRSAGISYATDMGNESPFSASGGVFYLSQEYSNHIPIARNAAYQILCLK